MKSPPYLPTIRLQVTAVALSAILYYHLLFLADRSFTIFPAALFTGLFVLYALLYRLSAQYHLLLFIALLSAIGFRLLALFAIPNLSDDFYRFIWDGRLLASGINPYADLPTDFMNGTLNPPQGIDCLLYEQLNSPLYYTVYPPVCQFIFWVSAVLAPNSIPGAVLIMKLFLLLCELGSIGLLYRLLKSYNLPTHRVLLYALNPLVIAEVVGNLHFEGAMLFFLLVMVYARLVVYNIPISAVAMGLAVCSKLIPLIFMPFMLLTLRPKTALAYSAVVGLVVGICFTPFLSGEVVNALVSSSALYYNKFEFNAGIYYLLRQLGYWLYGYNIIAWLGKVMALLSVLVILVTSFCNKQVRGMGVIGVLLWIYVSYILFATTVHPWYIIPLVAFCLFTPYRFPVVWSAMVLLSYSAYYHNRYTENLYLVASSYLIVMVFMLWEVWGKPLAQTTKIAKG